MKLLGPSPLLSALLHCRESHLGISESTESLDVWTPLASETRDKYIIGTSPYHLIREPVRTITSI